jgi:hypothetical protein
MFVAVALFLATTSLACGSSTLGSPTATTRTCVYSGDTLSGLRAFDRLVHANISCVVVFDDAAPDWDAWELPWFTYNRIANENWSRFASSPSHQLIITLNLFPSSLNTTAWRSIGATGGYVSHARTLARNLVRRGFGHAIIRLAHEANGTWYADNVGSTRAQWSEWKEFWRQTVIAMRSVPGAHFSFNWCIAAGYRPIPFSAYYPGNDVVNSIGVDIYDEGLPSGEPPLGTTRWTYQYDRPGGIGAIVRFARLQHEPLSIPEWGLVPIASGGDGDDPVFTEGIARLVRRTDALFQAYFFAESGATVLQTAPMSLAIYRADLLQR